MEIRKVILIITALSVNNYTVQAQIFDKIKNRVKETVENKAVNKAGEATEKGLDQFEGEVQSKKNNKTEQADEKGAIVQGANSAASDDLLAFRNYDFIAGDKLIYYYDMLEEEDSEIPGRMLLNSGNAEIQTYNGEKVLVAPAKGDPVMAPLMKDNAYLPEQFTLEFDVLSNGNSNTDGAELVLYFREKEKAGSGDATAPIRITLSTISGEKDQPHYAFEVFKNDNWFGTASKNFPPEAENSQKNNWRHVAIYVNKNISKLYIDQHRLAVLNQVEAGKANMVEIEVRTTEHPVMFKNFRIADGGSDAYNKVVTDGRFIAYGIQFDVNKAILKPESMGTINEFVKMLKENAALRFEIGGHTDIDGTAQGNEVLSQERATAVKVQMVKLGINPDRLTTKGYGANTPIVENDSAENKARNRRVEFVKL